MSFCRICLCKEPSRDLFQLEDVNQLNENDEKWSSEEIVLFCLGIQIVQDEKSTKLCEICNNKIIDFYNFKVLALKNDTYLNSIDSKDAVNIAVIDDYIKKEQLSDTQCSDDESHNVQEEEPYVLISTEDIKDECKSESVSDEELISTFKNQFQTTEMLEIIFTSGKRRRLKIGRNTVNARRARSARAQESSTKREARLSQLRERYRAQREKESSVEREARRRRARNKRRVQRARQSSAERKARLNQNILKTIENPPEKKKRGRPRKVKVEKFESKSVSVSKSAKTVCKHCGKKVANIKKHMELHLPLRDRQKFKCYICGLTFTCKYNMKKHIKRQHFSAKQKCQTCGKVVMNIELHMLVTHNKHKLPFECAVCQHRFINHHLLANHMTIHTKDRPYQCDHCLQTFSTKVSLSVHIRRVHNKEKSLLCQYCSKRFFGKYHLQAHLRSHTKEKPYKCDQCGKCYSRNCTLLKHTRAHANGQINVCSVCHKAFSNIEFFQKHMLSHTKEKKYPCRFCEQRFHRSDHRKGHETNVHKQTSIVTTK